MKVSVVIPVYKAEAYIEKCAKCLFEQTYEDLELIFVNDATPDNSIDRLKETLNSYPNRKAQVKIIRHEVNRGLIAARKTGMSVATGSVIGHCDSDDWVDKDFYEKLVAKMEKSGADIVFAPIITENPNAPRIHKAEHYISISGSDFLKTYEECRLVTPVYNKIYKQKLFEGEKLDWPEEISIAEDIAFSSQVLSRARKVCGIEDSFYHYRVNPASMTRKINFDKVFDSHERVYNVVTRSVNPDSTEAIRRYLIRMILYWGVVNGRLTRKSFKLWRNRFFDTKGNWDYSDMCLWGSRLMKIAGVSFTSARMIAPILRSRINDCI